MKLLADMHTHTVASGHAYSTIDENMRAAAGQGMQFVAMTDHAPMMQGTTNHAYFANLGVLPDMLHGVRLLKGIEVNIVDYEGTVDMDNMILSQMDIVIASLHSPCLKPGSRKENTRAYLAAMENPWIDVIGHPGDPRYDVDYEEVFERAKETGTLLEMNNASLIPGGHRDGSGELMERILRLSMRDSIPIIVGSDAHFYTGVGVFSYVEALFEKVGFPEELVLNTQPELLLNALKRNKKK